MHLLRTPEMEMSTLTFRRIVGAIKQFEKEGIAAYEPVRSRLGDGVAGVLAIITARRLPRPDKPGEFFPGEDGDVYDYLRGMEIIKD